MPIKFLDIIFLDYDYYVEFLIKNSKSQMHIFVLFWIDLGNGSTDWLFCFFKSNNTINTDNALK